MRPLPALVAIGAAWGLTMPVTKVAVSTGYAPFGLIFWQLVIAVVLLTGVQAARGQGLPRGRAAWITCLFVAVVGTLLPNSFSYRAAAGLPAGIMAIVIASVPMFALPLAVALGLDRPTLVRIAGLALGLGAVALIALPDISLPDPAMLAVLPIALIAPLCYALEGNGLAKWGRAGLDPLGVLWGASMIGLVLVTPLSLASGQFIAPTGAWSPQKSAILANGVLHVGAYSGYIWLIGRAGPVFAGQVSYLVTGFGVLWSMLILGESYAATVWAALALMLAGIALVQPRAPEGQDARA